MSASSKVSKMVAAIEDKAAPPKSVLEKVMLGSAVESIGRPINAGTTSRPCQKRRHRWTAWREGMEGISRNAERSYSGKVQESSPKKMPEQITRAICGVDAKLSRLSSIRFNVANVSKPLAAAVKVAEAGNLIVMHPDESKCFIQNLESGERMQMRKDRGTFVFDVVYEDTKETGTVTLDSGAGVSVWPRAKVKEGTLLHKKPGLKMIAANGTEIRNEGQKVIKFRGLSTSTAPDATFARPK